MNRLQLDLLELGARVALAVGAENVGAPDMRAGWIASVVAARPI